MKKKGELQKRIRLEHECCVNAIMRNVRYALLLFCLPLSRVEFKKSKSSVKRTFELATTKVHTNHYIQNLKIKRCFHWPAGLFYSSACLG